MPEIIQYDPTRPPPVVNGEYQFTPGVYRGVPDEVYFASNGYSNSFLKQAVIAPAKAKYGERQTSAPQSLGKLVHTAILEPHLLEARFAHSAENKNSNKWKEFKAANELIGREAVGTDKYEQAVAMADAVMARPGSLREFLQTPGLEVEVSFWWVDAETGLLCRGRADLALLQNGYAGDVKSCEDATDGFQRAVKDYKYHWQTAHYQDGLRTLGWPIDDFWFFALEKSAPYLYRPWLLPEHVIDHARGRLRIARQIVAACHKSGDWHGYPLEVDYLAYPEQWLKLYD